MTENEDCKDFRIGNIYEGVDDKKRLDIMAKYHIDRVKSTKDGRCDECKAKIVCRGGCTINNYFATGSLETIPEAYCKYTELCLMANERTVKNG